MWVHLIDADSKKIPNVALMKISAYYKVHKAFVTISKGDKLSFGNRLPDKVYISIIFKKNKHMFDGIESRFPYTQIDIGGSGYDLKKVLPPEIEVMKPDYSLYPEIDYSLGYSSRGCNRNCYFCVVPEKEGKFRRTQHPSEWYNEKFNIISFLDSNILFGRQWFFTVTDWCLEKGLKIDFQSGLDIRLVDTDVAKRLFEIRSHSMLNFAWDNVNDERVVREKIELLHQVGFTNSELRAHVQFYIYVDNDSEFNSGLYRCLELRKLSCNSFVMFNIDNERSERVHILQRWANKKVMYWSNSPESQRRLSELEAMADGQEELRKEPQQKAEELSSTAINEDEQKNKLIKLRDSTHNYLQKQEKSTDEHLNYLIEKGYTINMLTSLRNMINYYLVDDEIVPEKKHTYILLILICDLINSNVDEFESKLKICKDKLSDIFYNRNGRYIQSNLLDGYLKMKRSYKSELPTLDKDIPLMVWLDYLG